MDPRIIVFVGPSLPHPEARRLLAAEYRPPVRRGDLDTIAPGTVVGIIDGVFDQSLAVSPREIRAAARRGVAVLGSSSMGALRATEVREMEGVGRVHALFRDGAVEDDDEVALVFDPETLRPLSEPMVNVRHAVAALVRPGTLSAALGQRILAAAKRLPYPERCYPRILEEAGVPEGPERRQLATMLRGYDLKREDAITLLERLPGVTPPAPRAAEEAREEAREEPGLLRLLREAREGRCAADAPVFFWEFGDVVSFGALLTFLKMTDAFAAPARSAVARAALAGQAVAPAPLPEALRARRDARIHQLRGQWDWQGREEVLGAKVGAVLEEVEKWAQEQFPRGAAPEQVASYAALRARGARALDPRALDLPHDSGYHEGLEIGWRPLADVLAGEELLVPSAALDGARLRNDIYYSPRLGHKVFSTSGLASGFTLEEAAVHAVCELIERHALRLAELRLGNPGTPEPCPYRFMELESLPPSSQRIVRRVRGAGHRLSVLEISGEIAVPTFWAAIDGRWAMGFGTHPDPEVAVNQALLESAQAVFTAVAGAREDLTLRSRSLGRHERTRASTRAGRLLWEDPDPPRVPFGRVRGGVSRDALGDLRFLARALRAAGFARLLLLDLSQGEIRPARVVRALLPGCETTNPLCAGPRARAALLRDLLGGGYWPK